MTDTSPADHLPEHIEIAEDHPGRQPDSTRTADTGPGRAALTITVTGPDQANADRWAGGIRDMVIAEFGDSMLLAIHATPASDASLREQYAAALHRYDYDHGLTGNDLPGEHHRGEADAVLAVRDRRLATMERMYYQAMADLGETGDRADRLAADLDRMLCLRAMFEGLERLIATSSRDWGEYRVDAWLWAVLVGWDCEEEHEHDETCDDSGAMREMAAQHGWSDEVVAKARGYRAAVRAALDTAAAEPSASGGGR